MTLHYIFDTSKKEKRQKGKQPTTFYCHSDIATWVALLFFKKEKRQKGKQSTTLYCHSDIATRVALVHNFFITFQSNQV